MSGIYFVSDLSAERKLDGLNKRIFGEFFACRIGDTAYWLGSLLHNSPKARLYLQNCHKVLQPSSEVETSHINRAVHLGRSLDLSLLPLEHAHTHNHELLHKSKN